METTTTLTTILWSSALFSVFGTLGVFALFLLGTRARKRVATVAANETLPGVTLLKPCAGLDDDLEGCLESYCKLSYPRFQLLLGVRDESDPALPVLRRVQERHPEVDLQVLITHGSRLLSPKISNVEVLAQHARYELFWMSDSNTKVHPDTLTDLVQKLHEPGIGMVISPLYAQGARTPGARFDALTIDVFVGITTYAIYTLLGMVTTPGKSLLFRRSTLEAAGGWEHLGNYFGEDIIFMEAVRSLGLRLALGAHPVANITCNATMEKYWHRHLRWAQIRWRFSPVASLFEPLLAPIVPTTVLALAAPSSATLLLLLLALVQQVSMDLVIYHRVTTRAFSLEMLPWMLLRPFLAFALSLRGVYAGPVNWRGNVLYMGPQSRCLREAPLTTLLKTIKNYSLPVR